MNLWQRPGYCDPSLLPTGVYYAVVGRAFRKVEQVSIFCGQWAPTGAWEVVVWNAAGLEFTIARERLYPTHKEAAAFVQKRLDDRYVAWLRNTASNRVRKRAAEQERARRHAERTGCDCCCLDCCAHNKR